MNVSFNSRPFCVLKPVKHEVISAFATARDRINRATFFARRAGSVADALAFLHKYAETLVIKEKL